MSKALKRYIDALSLRDPRYGSIRELAGRKTGLARVSVAWAEIDVGAISPAHWHDITEEIYAVVEGRGRMYLDGHVFDIAAGDVVSIAPGVIHAVENLGSDPLSIIVATSPEYDENDDHEVES